MLILPIPLATQPKRAIGSAQIPAVIALQEQSNALYTNDVVENTYVNMEKSDLLVVAHAA